MTEQEKDELIARFMGGKVLRQEPYKMPHGSNSKGVLTHWKVPEEYPFRFSNLASLGNFDYGSSWDCLMPVVKKICLIPLTKYEDAREAQREIENLSIFNERGVVIDKIVDFLNQYNNANSI